MLLINYIGYDLFAKLIFFKIKLSSCRLLSYGLLSEILIFLVKYIVLLIRLIRLSQL